MAITHADGTVSHTGLVLHSTTNYNSSMEITSWYAVVWNPETQTTESIYSHDDYSPRNEQGSFTVDATDEIRAQYAAMRAEQSRIAHEQAEERERNRVDKGKTVKVVRGRKVPIGTTGLVFWVGNNGYGTSVGIRDAAGNTHFTAITNVEVYTLPETELTAITVKAEESKQAWLAAQPKRERTPYRSHYRPYRTSRAY